MGCGASEICPGPFFKILLIGLLKTQEVNSVEKVREIRDEIECKVKELVLSAQ
jgi:hypothetical protein